MPLTSPGNDDDTGENHQPTLRKNTAEPVEQTLKQNTYYKRKREQGKHHNAAIICLARRRCDVIYSMLKNGTLYQEPALVA